MLGRTGRLASTSPTTPGLTTPTSWPVPRTTQDQHALLPRCAWVRLGPRTPDCPALLRARFFAIQVGRVLSARVQCVPQAAIQPRVSAGSQGNAGARQDILDQGVRTVSSCWDVSMAPAPRLTSVSVRRATGACSAPSPYVGRAVVPSMVTAQSLGSAGAGRAGRERTAGSVCPGRAAGRATVTSQESVPARKASGDFCVIGLSVVEAVTQKMVSVRLLDSASVDLATRVLSVTSVSPTLAVLMVSVGLLGPVTAGMAGRASSVISWKQIYLVLT